QQAGRDLFAQLIELFQRPRRDQLFDPPRNSLPDPLHLGKRPSPQPLDSRLVQRLDDARPLAHRLDPKAGVRSAAHLDCVGQVVKRLGDLGVVHLSLTLPASPKTNTAETPPLPGISYKNSLFLVRTTAIEAIVQDRL